MTKEECKDCYRDGKCIHQDGEAEAVLDCEECDLCDDVATRVINAMPD